MMQKKNRNRAVSAAAGSLRGCRRCRKQKAGAQSRSLIEPSFIKSCARRNHPCARVLRLRCQNATHRPPNLARTPNTMIMLMGHRHPSRRFLQLSFSGKKTMAATASQAINAVHHADARRRYGQSASLFRRQNAPRRVLSIRPGVA